MADCLSICYLNGDFASIDEARISVLDRGFLFGDAVYELVPVYSGHTFCLDRHYRRLSRSLAEIRLSNPYDCEALQQLADELIGRNGGGDLTFYIQISRGAAKDRNHLFPSAVESTVFAMVGPFPPPPAGVEEQGIAAVLLDDTRWNRCDIKSTSLIANVLLRQLAEESDAGEAILVRDGRITEGSSSSVFIVRDGTIVTPPDSTRILPGVTRDVILELARGAKIEVAEADFSPDELLGADEVWISSSAREVLPVTRVDDHAIANGRPGPVWQTIYGAFQKFKTHTDS